MRFLAELRGFGTPLAVGMGCKGVGVLGDSEVVDEGVVESEGVA